MTTNTTPTLIKTLVTVEAAPDASWKVSVNGIAFFYEDDLGFTRERAIEVALAEYNADAPTEVEV